MGYKHLKRSGTSTHYYNSLQKHPLRSIGSLPGCFLDFLALNLLYCPRSKEGVKVMARALKRIDISRYPELLKLVEQARSANEPVMLHGDKEDVAILRPLKRPAKQRIPRGRPTSADDPLWKIIGMARSEGPGDVSENVDKYLAEAYLPEA